MTHLHVWSGTDSTLREYLRRIDENNSAVWSPLSRAVEYARTFAVRIVEGVRRNRYERTAVRQLSALDDRLLQDIGIDRADIRSVVHGLANRRQA